MTLYGDTVNINHYICCVCKQPVSDNVLIGFTTAIGVACPMCARLNIDLGEFDYVGNKRRV